MSRAWVIFCAMVFLIAGTGLCDTGVSQENIPTNIITQDYRGSVSGRFAEVEIQLDETVGLSEIESLSKAPGAEIEIFEGGSKVRTKLLQSDISALSQSGSEVEVLRNFLVVEPEIQIASTIGALESSGSSCSGTYYYGYAPNNHRLKPECGMYGMTLHFTPFPSQTVKCISVY